MRVLLTLEQHISEFHGGVKASFARELGVDPQEVTRMWKKKDKLLVISSFSDGRLRHKLIEIKREF